jgi:hypothetical protein
MGNKIQKFLIALSSFFAFALLVMGLKIQNDNKKIEQLTRSAEPNATEDPSQTVTDTNTNLDNSAQFPIGDTVSQMPMPTTAPAKITPPATPAPQPVAKPTKKTKTS